MLNFALFFLFLEISVRPQEQTLKRFQHFEGPFRPRLNGLRKNEYVLLQK